MLRLLTERLRIYLHPERIVLVRETGLFKRRIIAKLSIPVSPVTDVTSWQSVILTLSNALEKPEWKGLRATVVLSGFFVKYRIADWHEQLSHEEQIMLLKHRFEEIYGPAAEGWKVFISNTGFKKNELACAVDIELLNAIHMLFVGQPWRLSSVQPFLTTAINHMRKKISPSAWLIIVEKGVVHFVRFTDDGWKSVRSKVIESPEAQLALLFEREVLLTEDSQSSSPIYLFWPDNPDYRLLIAEHNNIQVLKLKDLSGFSVNIDAHAACAIPA